MMEKFILIIGVFVLIYFTIKRIEDKKNEDFENRDN